MIVRSLQDIEGDPQRDVRTPEWRSQRLLLKSDNMGFSFHVTTIPAGNCLNLAYKNHLEAVYCMSGKGHLTDKASGKTYAITPGTMYALNAHDAHAIAAEETLSLMCVFNPPVVGNETHLPDGSYPLVN